jgi:hypothetical protein
VPVFLSRALVLPEGYNLSAKSNNTNIVFLLAFVAIHPVSLTSRWDIYLSGKRIEKGLI